MKDITHNKQTSKPSLFYKVVQNGKTITHCRTRSVRRFKKNIGTINWQDVEKKGRLVYLRVNYGKLLDFYGKMSYFHNDADCYDEGSLLSMLEIFLED